MTHMIGSYKGWDGAHHMGCAHMGSAWIKQAYV